MWIGGALPRLNAELFLYSMLGGTMAERVELQCRHHASHKSIDMTEHPRLMYFAAAGALTTRQSGPPRILQMALAATECRARPDDRSLRTTAVRCSVRAVDAEGISVRWVLRSRPQPREPDRPPGALRLLVGTLVAALLGGRLRGALERGDAAG